ncbi:hypothetical protein D0861_03983 [Hortaea werneckii]|uniref:Uncharacterized protein n=1 Tax=Hortaea werneckii TaxID=91943 RepID=A0A3M7FLU8_HORWE|nr:hypothetical protein D0861_03983 [Hortaea werneckii]
MTPHLNNQQDGRQEGDSERVRKACSKSWECSGLQEAKDEMCACKAQSWTILSEMSQNATALHLSTSS